MQAQKMLMASRSVHFMSALCIILGDQLSLQIPALKHCNKKADIILMCEVLDEATYVKHHKKKIAFLFSAMRHFAHQLTQLGYQVCYRKLDDVNNSGSFSGEVAHCLQVYHCDKIIITHPGEYRVLTDINAWEKQFAIPVTLLEDTRFLCTLDEFATWTKNRKQLRMEYFYRTMRQKHNILMNGNKPVGGQWNYDSENRKPANDGLSIPQNTQFEPDEITQEVLALVTKCFANHFGDLQPFNFAVTRRQALVVLQTFIEQRLCHFGDYQDAMMEGQPWMYHSHVSFYLNCGLLSAEECVRAVEQAYYDDKAPLNAAEGFIRQIIGWREYIRGIYWLRMPGYDKQNFLDAKKDLPSFYWQADSSMNCLKQCVKDTKENAYAHHIQRLMVLGNFALLAGIDPVQVNEWYLIVYADAYEWVELPNVTGMILFADGGYLASKPYAAGGNYINKMSNYCKNCRYKVSKKNGPDACPFNYLYWNFLAVNRDKLSDNHRLGIMYRNYDSMSDEKKKAIEEDSIKFLASLD